MKKLVKFITLASVAVFALSLSACAKTSSAKEVFIDDLVSFSKQSQKSPSQEIKIDLKKFKASGSSDLSELDKLQGSKIDLTTGIDRTNKLVSLAANLNYDQENYKVDGIFAKSGLYFNSEDLKNIYSKNKKMITSGDSNTAMIFDSLLGSLNKPYLLLDQTTMNQAMSKQGQSYDEVFNSMFKTQTSKLTKKKLTEKAKNVPESYFEVKDGKDIFTMNNKDGNFSDFLKGYMSVTNNVSESQEKKLLKQTKDIKMKNISAKIVFDKKNLESDIEMSGKLIDKDKSTIDFDISVNTKSSKLKEALKEPKGQSMTVEDLENAMISKMESQQE